MRRGLHAVGWMAGLMGAAVVAVADALPVFDAHLHYNADSRALYTPTAVIDILDRAGVSRALLSSTPNDGTQLLYTAYPDRFVPLLRPYRDDSDRGRWFRDVSVPAWLEQQLTRGSYRGIGEFHLNGDQAGTAVLRDVVALATKHGLVLHAHADADAVHALLGVDAKAKVLWAHAGMSATPAVIGAMLARYPTLSIELSLRDDEIAPGGRLDAAWRALFERYSDRFLLGTDTWTPSRWAAVELHADHSRRWLAQLTRAQAEAIAFGNAERLFPPTGTGTRLPKTHGQT